MMGKKTKRLVFKRSAFIFLSPIFLSLFLFLFLPAIFLPNAARLQRSRSPVAHATGRNMPASGLRASNTWGRWRKGDGGHAIGIHFSVSYLSVPLPLHFSARHLFAYLSKTAAISAAALAAAVSLVAFICLAVRPQLLATSSESRSCRIVWVRSLSRLSHRPQPRCSTRVALSNWSNAIGRTTWGIPADMACEVLPIPPWCTSRGKQGTEVFSCTTVPGRFETISRHVADALASQTDWKSRSSLRTRIAPRSSKTNLSATTEEGPSPHRQMAAERGRETWTAISSCFFRPSFCYLVLHHPITVFDTKSFWKNTAVAAPHHGRIEQRVRRFTFKY